MTLRARLCITLVWALAACARATSAAPTPSEVGPADPTSLAGTWRMTGQMMSRGFSFVGSITLEVVGDQVTGQFRMRTPSARFGEVAGSYRDGYLVLNGWHEIELSFQCRGQANLRLAGSGNRLTGTIEMVDGCNQREFRGSVRLQR